MVKRFDELGPFCGSLRSTPVYSSEAAPPPGGMAPRICPMRRSRSSGNVFVRSTSRVMGRKTVAENWCRRPFTISCCALGLKLIM
jgi:hypothetical protein